MLPAKDKKFQLMPYVWVAVALGSIYVSNFFYNIFNNPKIRQPFFSISMASFSFLTVYAIYVSYALPLLYKVKNCQEYNPKIITVGAWATAISIIGLVLAIWPVWGWTSLWLLGVTWKGFWQLGKLLPRGKHSNRSGLIFILLNFLTVQSHKFYGHGGYLH